MILFTKAAYQNTMFGMVIWCNMIFSITVLSKRKNKKKLTNKVCTVVCTYMVYVKLIICRTSYAELKFIFCRNVESIIRRKSLIKNL